LRPACAGSSDAAGSAPLGALPAPEPGELRLEVRQGHVLLEFPRPLAVLASAPYNGGFGLARRFFILQVDANLEGGGGHAPPEETLRRHCRANGWRGRSVGFMTAASMGSCRRSAREQDGLRVDVALTAGLGNARRAGDPADLRGVGQENLPAGTINILAVTNARLTDAAMLEALMIVTEAKAAVLQDLGVKSPVSGLTATGTGTDCAAVARGDGPRAPWCGKHVLLGEMLAQAVMEALTASVKGWV